ncbi:MULTISPECIES: NADPH-dependent FMN reductase [Streptomyces]|uniref:NADPH-dependent FMN reductase n=1 Tax=Streptomyces TaxID=1883 RepID=UPI0004BDCE1B|nr:MULTISPECIES: NAD(P)H-dependent oxidoreductase [unclassified Streptomyces]MBG7700308.1 NAD(P)H-dependent oxidoreductase [Streptomyces sp. MC1]
MSDAPLRVALVIGSTRATRFGPTVARWFAEQAGQNEDVALDVVDLADFPLPVAITDSPEPADAAIATALSSRLDAAEAFVVLTPEYNHSFPAPLKVAIDWNYTQWQAKPIGFVSYGGLSGGLRAVEQLRQVYAEMHAVTLRDTVSFHGAAATFDADGNPKDPTGCSAAAKTMLDQLVWWGTALREARAKRPYRA